MDIKETADRVVSVVEVEKWKHGFAEVDGIRLHYVEQGEGFPVLLVHGMPELWYIWHHQITALAGAGFRAIAPDSRGYGQSGRPEGLHHYTAQKKTGELVGLLDVLGIEKAVFVGHDWGAAWSWHAGRIYPDRVERIICTLGAGGSRHWSLMSKHGVPAWPADSQEKRPTSPEERLQPFVIWDRWSRPVSWMDLRSPGYAEYELSKDPDWLEALTRACAAPTREPFPDRKYVEVLRATYGTVEGMKGTIDHYRNFGLNTEAMMKVAGTKITCPCLLLAGEDDPWAPPRGSDKAIIEVSKERIPNLTVRWVKGAGHWVQIQKPDDFNRHMLDFLKDLAGKH
jgi:pimeloyl-ACP methyl ester carboxylesterase